MNDLNFDVLTSPPADSINDEQRFRPRGSTPKIPKTGNDALAAQATEVLLQLNSVICAGLFITGLTETSSAIAAREEGFKAQAYQALLTDAKLCKTILRARGTGGLISLLLAYGLLGGAIAPVAMNEIKTKKGTGELGVGRILQFLRPPVPTDDEDSYK